MRYLDEVRAFHEYLLNNALSSGEIALWHALMGHNNRLGWLEEFSVSNLMAQQLTSLSRSGLDRARNQLKQRGLLHYKAGKSGRAGHYRMVSVVPLAGNIMGTTEDKLLPDQCNIMGTTEDKLPDQCNIMGTTEDKLPDQCNIMDMTEDINRAHPRTEAEQTNGTLTRLRLRLRQGSVVTATSCSEMSSHDPIKQDLQAYVDAQLGDKGEVLSGDLDYFLSKGMTGEEIRGAVDIAKSKGKPWRYAKGVLTNQLNDRQGGNDHATGKRDADSTSGIDERWSKGALY